MYKYVDQSTCISIQQYKVSVTFKYKSILEGQPVAVSKMWFLRLFHSDSFY